MSGKPQIEYNTTLAPLEELLAGVVRNGDFSVQGCLEMPMPKIEVEGVGVLSFPIPHEQAEKLISQATRAPYGRGPDTILDESVRKVWQLPSEKVRISGRSWPTEFQKILDEVSVGLGYEGVPVTAEFYKMLVYDAGGFFLAHRDTEKASGMFGTLVLCLPSLHRGGELIIRHAGREAVIDLSGGEVSEIRFAAFYADCEHEVRPIIEGHRVCLVYNLIQQPDPETETQPLHAPQYEHQIEKAAALLKEYLPAPGGPIKIAWLLEHHYSPEGLSFSALKSADAARARVLAQAAERAGCAVHLGIVHIEESGAAESYYAPGYGRGWRSFHRTEIDESDFEDFNIIEVGYRRHYASRWRDLHDQPVELGEIPIAPGELLPNGALEDEKPDHQRYMEASGNEGASFERAYHRAAVVIWRRDQYAEVLLQAGIGAVLPYFQEQVQAALTKGAPKSAKTQAVKLARRMIEEWEATLDHPFDRPPPKADQRNKMIELLKQLGDKALLRGFIARIVIHAYNGEENAALIACAEHLGPAATGRLYAELLKLHASRLPVACVDLLCGLVSRFAPDREPNWREPLCILAETIVQQLGEITTEPARRDWRYWYMRRQPESPDASFVTRLLEALAALDATRLRTTAVETFIAQPRLFDPVEILVPALTALGTHDEATDRLWTHCAAFLLERSGSPPVAPTDWRQDVTLPCRCADCRELQAFAGDPHERVHRFRLRQDRRLHLHEQIERSGLDMTHVTERKGSPHTLVCTKTRRRYARQCEQYRKDIEALAALAGHAPAGPKHRPVLQAVERARNLAAAWTPAF